jgi:hypothetical protein
MVEIVQGLAKFLKMKWKLHTVFKHQSSGKVEHMNQTLKITLHKFCQETQSPWIDMLPLALLMAHCTPRPSGYSPFEILYGRPPPVINRLRGDLRQTGNLDMSQHLQALGKTLCHISWEVLERTPIRMVNWAHPHQPGDMVWVKDWKKEPLQSSWTGPHVAILAIPTAVKVAGVTPWIHHSQIKKAAVLKEPND